LRVPRVALGQQVPHGGAQHCQRNMTMRQCHGNPGTSVQLGSAESLAWHLAQPGPLMPLQAAPALDHRSSASVVQEARSDRCMATATQGQCKASGTRSMYGSSNRLGRRSVSTDMACRGSAEQGLQHCIGAHTRRTTRSRRHSEGASGGEGLSGLTLTPLIDPSVDDALSRTLLLGLLAARATCRRLSAVLRAGALGGLRRVRGGGSNPGSGWGWRERLVARVARAAAWASTPLLDHMAWLGVADLLLAQV
jgi:hypothetical protein